MDGKDKNSRYLFPEEGQPLEKVRDELLAFAKKMQERGYQSGKILGFPGTTPHKAALEALRIFSEINPNNILTHTKEKDDLTRENDVFAITQELERQVIYMLGSLLGSKDPEAELDGYICSGATAANQMGLWIARNALLTPEETDKNEETGKSIAGQKGAWNFDYKNDGICIIAPISAHYSIGKTANLIWLGEGSWGECDEDPPCKMSKHVFQQNPNFLGLVYAKLNKLAQVDVNDVEQIILQASQKGVHRFIIVGTAGTTLSGAIDPVDKLAKLIDRLETDQELKFFLHVDAAFGGMVVPFLRDKDQLPKFAFDLKRVDSVAIDFDKMGLVPYPAGIFLCRKGKQKYVERHVNYIASNIDDTLEGSRPGSAAAACLAVIKAEGRTGFQITVEKCMRNTHYLKEKLSAIEGIEILVPPVTNILALCFSTKHAELAFERCLSKCGHIVAEEWFQRTPTECPRKAYRFVVMPHVSRAYIDQFIADLAKMISRCRTNKREGN